jgi:hypothetical protein
MNAYIADMINRQVTGSRVRCSRRPMDDIWHLRPFREFDVSVTNVRVIHEPEHEAVLSTGHDCKCPAVAIHGVPSSDHDNEHTAVFLATLRGHEHAHHGRPTNPWRH